MRSATRLLVSSFGTLAGAMGIEHGLGEVLQGNRAPAGVVIASWPGSDLFKVLDGEPAMTLIPNLLASGLLSILVSVAFIGWALRFVEKKHGGLVLILLSAAMLLVGGGFGPPLLGTIVGSAATRLHAPLTWWRAHVPAGTRRVLASAWPWLFAATWIAWLALFPGSILVGQLRVLRDPAIWVVISVFAGLGLLLLTIFVGLARDAQERPDAPAAMPGREGTWTSSVPTTSR